MVSKLSTGTTILFYISTLIWILKVKGTTAAILITSSSFSAKLMFAANWASLNNLLLLQGVAIPALHVMFANWFPPNERVRISGVIFSGK